MRPVHVVTAAVVLLASAAAYAGPFAAGDLFFGRAVKPTRADRLIEGGVRFEIAPVRAVSKEVLAGFRREHPELDPVFDFVKQVDPGVLADADAERIRRALLGLPRLSAQDRAAIEQAFPADGGGAELQRALDAVHLLAPVLTDAEDAVSFSLAPYLLLNLDPIAISVEVPMASFASGGETAFTLANASLDLRFGHHWGESVAIGLTYGVTTWFPTGGARADTLALANLLAAPRFLHQNLSFDTYVALGVDLGFLLVQAHVDLIDLVPVRDGPRDEVGVLLGYGGSLVLSGWGVVALNVELDGTANLRGASELATLSLAVGPRLDVFGLKLGAAVQIPFAVGEKRTYASYAGLDLGSPADVNVVLTLAYAY